MVVVGGGFGGATAAKYIRMWDPSIDVVLVERESRVRLLPDLEPGARRLLQPAGHQPQLRRAAPARRAGGARRGHGDRRGEENRAPGARRRPRLRAPGRLAGHRLHLRRSARATKRRCRPAACCTPGKPGPQTVALRQQLEQMRDGGVYILSIPMAPYRCPPGPYERASVVAAYFKEAKPRSKVLVLDANPDVTSKAGLFKRAWSDLYPGIIEYRGNSRAVAVDGERAHGEARARRRQGRRAERRAAAPRGGHRADGGPHHRPTTAGATSTGAPWNRRR